MITLDLQTICTPRKYVRGIAYYTIELVRNLLQRGNYDYIGSFFDYQKERNNRGNIEEYLGDSVSKFKYLYENNEICYPDMLSAISQGDSSFYQGKTYDQWMGMDADLYHFFHLSRMPHNIPDKPTIVTVHDVMPVLNELKDGFAQGTYEQFMNSFQYVREHSNITVVADSECTKKDLVYYGAIHPERIHVVPAAINETLYYPDASRSDIFRRFDIPKEYILYLGALDPRKGIDTLMEAERILKNRDIPIVLTGNPSDMYNLSKEMEKTENPKRFILTGYVTDEEKRSLLSNATVFVFPSRYEGFGLPILEAMACGTPVITTEVSSIPEVGGDAVEYIRPGDCEALATLLDDFLEHEEKRKDLRARGFEQCKKFSWSGTAQQIEEIYRMIG